MTSTTDAYQNRVFKFRSGNENDLAALHGDYIWFSSLMSQNDPYEGYINVVDDADDSGLKIRFFKELQYRQKNIPRPQTEALALKLFATQPEEFLSSINNALTSSIEKAVVNIRREVSIYCVSQAEGFGELFPKPLSNLLMWSHYANSFRGFCIEFDFDLLCTSLGQLNGCEVSHTEVMYGPALPEVRTQDLMRRYSDSGKLLEDGAHGLGYSKSSEWEYERELRLHVGGGGAKKINPECIRAIYFSERTPCWLKDSVKAILAPKVSSIRFFEAFIDTQTGLYELSFRPI